MGLADAEHEETAPGANTLVVSKLVCSLAGAVEKVYLQAGTLAYRAYGQVEAEEAFACNYGLNPAYRALLDGGALRVSGSGPDGEVRIVEIPALRFFVATLFLPQVRSAPGQPHPLIMAYVRGVLNGTET